MWMKVLVGAACIAVIAFVGYYFWNEYRAAEMHKRQAYAASCARIVTTNEKYDEKYASSMSNEERIYRLRQCVDFYETGKMR